MTVVDGRWPFAARDAEVAAIQKVLTSDAGHGVVLVGPAGVGKTMIAQRVLASMSRHVDHMYLRGSAAHATTPYGALNVLLAELDEDTARSPLLVLSALQRRFDGDSSTRRTLMHIDGVEDIDELSATVIAHLARVGAVRLVVTCEDILRAPGEFLDLWKDGVLERFDIQPLTPDGATAMLTAALGAPVSRSASHELWSASSGNPRYLQLATKADVASGHLFQRDGVWVSRDTPRPGSGRSITDWTMARLADLDPEDRAVIEVLSVSGAAPLALLLQAAPSTALDALQEEGVLTLDLACTPLVRITYDVLADVVRSQLISRAGQAALAALAALRDHADMPVRSRIALALWLLEQGELLGADELIALATSANDHRIDGAAERFLDAVPSAELGGAAAIEQTRHLLDDGRLTDAIAAVDGLLSDSGAELTLDLWVTARLLAARLLTRSRARAREAPALLDDVVRRLSEEPATPEVADLAGRTEVQRLELHLFEGELDRIVERVPAALAGRAETSRWSTRIRSILGVAQCAMGQQDQAVALARSVGARLADPAASSIDRELAAAHLFGSLVVAGEWTEALELAGDSADPAGALLFAGSPTESAEGVVLAFLGRSTAALAKLIPAISQLRIRDRHGMLPLAEAAAAYALVLESEPDAAEDHLRAIDLTTQRHAWHVREAVHYFRLLAEAWLDGPAVAVAGLLERARELNAVGHHGIELFFFVQAVQFGARDATGSLATVCASTEGRFAALCGSFATALAAQDSQALKDTARDVLETGHYCLAGDIAAFSIEHLEETDDPMIRVHAEQILRRTSTPARRHVRRKLLSERERAIARMVARGVPNKEIAQQEHISHRTVEGHVHQVMTKLGLTTRKQLALIFGPQP